MMTVNEVSKFAGVSVRTLQYYDKIGLLKPSEYTEAGYRLYSDESLKKLEQILLYRELEFSLDEIKRIVNSPDFDVERAIDEQIELLKMKREHLDKLIDFACRIKDEKEHKMDFSAFDKTKIEEYSKKAKEKWEDTAAYKEYEEKSRGRDSKTQNDINEGLMQIFVEFGKIKYTSPEGKAAQSLVKKLRDYITANFYDCKKEILSNLGMMYAAGGEFTENIDKAGGEGTAQFAADAIDHYCK